MRAAHRDDGRHRPRPPERLLIEWPSGESRPSRFWLSTYSFDLPVSRLVRLAKLRRRIERDYQELKEGSPILPAMSVAQDQSYERLPGFPGSNGQDTDNNSADFVLHLPPVPSNPQNMASLCFTPPPPRPALVAWRAGAA